MDKTEYNQKLDELSVCLQNGDYAQALEIVDSIDWRRVKSIRTLNMAADVYERNKEYQKEKEVLKIAYNHSSIGRNVLSRLVEVCLKMGDIDEAERYFREFSKVAVNDNSRYLLQYKLYKAQNAPLNEQIAVLEEYREKEYTERWAYELAKLYAKAGDRKKCVETCDDLILWFSEGKYVVRAMELKMRFEPLTPSQKALYAEIRATGYRKETAPQASPEELPAAEGASAAEGKISSAGEEVFADPAVRQAAMTTADMDAERIARILAGDFEQEEPQEGLSEEAADVEAELTEDAPETEGAEQKDNISPEEIDLSDLDDDDDEDEENTPDLSLGISARGTKKKADASEEFGEEAGEESDEAAEAEEKSSPEPFRNRIFRSFQDVFSGLGKDDSSDRIQRPDEEGDPESDEERYDFRVKELEPEDEAARDSAHPGNSEYAGMRTEDFNLDDFLSETMGSFAGELASGGFEGASTTKTVPDTGSIDLPPAASDAEAHSSGVVAPSVEESIAALRFEMPSDEEKDAASEEQTAIPEEEAAQDTGAEVEDIAEAELVYAEEDSEDQEPADFNPEENGAEETETDRRPSYNEELEIPDPEPTEEDRRSRTITLSSIGQNTVPISLNKILSSETPEERRIRILNNAKPTRMSEEQRQIFTYFARIPGMDNQILEALNGVYRHAGERTSLHGNIAVMGAVGTGKSRLTRGLIVAMCRDMGLDAAKVARVSGGEMNQKDPAQVVDVMSGGFLAIEDVSLMTADTVQKLNQAMEFRTDCMILIIEDEKTNMRSFLKKHPQFAAKFEKVISIPVFTNDELVAFARTYATENGCKMDDLGILALYTKIGNKQTEEEPMTIAKVKEMVDDAIHRASRGRKKSRRGRDRDKDRWIILHEKDFE